jgi:hypothetical protein
MSAIFNPLSARKAGPTAACAPGDDCITATESAPLSDRACCCAAKAVVRVIMPPAAARRHSTALLLCGHHYRVSRQALKTAKAVVTVLPGTSPDIATWIDTSQVTTFAETLAGSK